MDAVDDFRINIDLSDRERVHDYVSGRTLTRPESGTWDPEVFKGLGEVESIPKEDENKQLLVGLQDNAILDKGFFEKKVETGKDGKEKPKSTELDEIFGGAFDMGVPGKDLPGRVLPVYKPGDVVKGHLILKLNKELQAEKVDLDFLGQFACNIRIYHRYGYYDDTKKDKFVEEERILWEKASSKDAFSDVSQAFDELQVTDTPATSKVLPPGSHRFGFEFRIPHEGGQSMPPLVHSTVNYARLFYRLKATVKFGKTFGRGNLVTHKGIWVRKSYDIASDKEGLEPASAENTLDTGAMPFWKSGKVQVNAQLPRSAFIKGEPIPLSIEIDNKTSGDIFKVKARVLLQGKTLTGKWHISKSICLKSKKVMEGPIASGMSPIFKWDLPWDFSGSSADSALMPVGKLDDSKLLEMHYGVAIKVKRKGLHRNMELYLPITIGTEDSTAVPQKGATASLYPSLG